MRRAACSLAALLCAALPAGAHAYRFQCNGMDAFGNVRGDGCSCTLSNAQRWTAGIIDWRAKRTTPSTLSSSAWLNAVSQALNGWNSVACKSFSMREIGDVATPDFGTNSGQQTLWWVTSRTQFQQVVGAGVDSTLGVTSSPYVFERNCGARYLTDADVVMNHASDTVWTTNMASCSGNCVNVASVVLHEMGHAFGLGHPCTGQGDCPAGGAVMAAISAYRENTVFPFQDDVNGICALYPGTPGTLGAPCTRNADCQSNICASDNGVTYCSQSCGTCPSGFRCTDGRCLRAGAPRVGEPCVGSCEAGALCLEDESGRKCFRQCTPGSSPSGCGTGERCADLGSNVGACVPEGTRRPGEQCGGSFGECVTGATCYLIEEGATTGYCFKDCTQNTDCASSQRCDTSSGTPGLCIGARPEGASCGESIEALCNVGLLCLCADEQCATGRCARECTTQPSVCLAGQRCELLSDNRTRVCVQTVTEGQSCGQSVCADGLLCVRDTTTGAHCYIDCASASCPAGKECNAYGSGPSRIFICEVAPVRPDGGPTAPDAGTGADAGTPRDGGSGGLRPVGESCDVDESCESGLCASASDAPPACTSLCDPSVGNHQCQHGLDREACVAASWSDLGGICLGGQAGDGEVGASCRNGAECRHGICFGGACTRWCDEGGSCGELEEQGYRCDATGTAPGFCRKRTTGPAESGCSQLSSSGGPMLALLFAVLAWLGVRRRGVRR